MQCPDCKQLRHDGECKTSYEQLIWERDGAFDQYMMEIKQAPPVRERTKELQATIDRLLGIYQAASRRIWHSGII